MGKPEALAVGLEISDVSGQKRARVDVPPDATVGEMVQDLLSQMRLPRNDAAGQPVSYRARHDREGRALHSSERVGEALATGDRVVLQPNIDAGAGASDD